MDSMLKSKVGQKLASLTQPQLFDTLINDAYKPKMHKIYATYLRGVKVDFALNVRKSPFQLQKIEQEVIVHHRLFYAHPNAFRFVAHPF